MDWNKMEKDAGLDNVKQFKAFAPNGKHKVKLESVEVIDLENWKSPALRFNWKEDDQYKYPKSVYHWLSLGNPSWRAVHNRNILMALGIEKEKAEQLVEGAEKDSDRAKLVKAYDALYKRIAERGVETTIAVQDQWQDGKPLVVTTAKGTTYTPNESDFDSSLCRMMRGHEEKQGSLLDDGDNVNLSEIPF